jgi:hypothetical protein
MLDYVDVQTYSPRSATYHIPDKIHSFFMKLINTCARCILHEFTSKICK